MSRKRSVSAVTAAAPGAGAAGALLGRGPAAGADDKAEAHIDVGSEGVKRLLLRYAPVEKL